MVLILHKIQGRQSSPKVIPKMENPESEMPT